MSLPHLVPVLLALGLATAQAGVYSWVDANGQRHFGDQPPPEAGATELEIRPIPATRFPGVELPKAAADEARADAEAAAPSPPPAEDPAVSEARRKNCAAARGNLKALETQARVKVVGDDGEVRYPRLNQRDDLIQRAREQITEFCDQ